MSFEIEFNEWVTRLDTADSPTNSLMSLECAKLAGPVSFSSRKLNAIKEAIHTFYFINNSDGFRI